MIQAFKNNLKLRSILSISLTRCKVVISAAKPTVTTLGAETFAGRNFRDSCDFCPFS